MQTPKRRLIGGTLTTVFLTDYDAGSDSYSGEAHTNVSLDIGQPLPQITPVSGARPYPYAERPDYAFQFVELGESEQPLLDIGQRNAAGHPHAPPAEKPVEEVQDGQAVFDSHDTNHDGIVSKEEKREARKNK